VLAVTKQGKAMYGHRQNMDITNPDYLCYCERVIRKLLEVSAYRHCVIGFQLDNETKYYGTAGKNVQEQFVKYLRKKFHDDLDALNAEFGFDYWSNRINAWEDFPDVRGTINGSLGAEFEKFQRTLVDDFLAWQADIVKEYRREDQFITQNFDFEWRGYSYGVQPDVNHYHAARSLTIAGVDIYHPTQDDLTGTEIAFGGDMTRSLKNGNYLLLETEAQGFPEWTPYPGQLRLQAYSHLASGSNSVMYWHWHSLHNSFETYWKGVLSHDFAENEVYREACVIGAEFRKIGGHLVNLKKKNHAAILVSNEALTALKWFPIRQGKGGSIVYNDVVRWIYDALYRMNIECDFLWPESENFNQYRVIFVPALYAAPEGLLEKLENYTKNGGTLFATFKTAFADENVKVHDQQQPYLLRSCFGVTYHQFTYPQNVGLSGKLFDGQSRGKAEGFMELLIPEGAQVLSSYEHESWKAYAAVTKNHYGDGTAFYTGCMMDEMSLKTVLMEVLREAKIAVPKCHYPLIVRKGRNDYGKIIWYYLNYSSAEQTVSGCEPGGTELLTGCHIKPGTEWKIPAWDLRIVEESE
ncbi:MAG: beta-galactosidase, partial [Fusicatenibacter sp.]